MKARIAVLMISVLAFGACSTGEMTDEEILTHATELHADLLTIDTHVDISSEFGTGEADPGVRPKS